MFAPTEEQVAIVSAARDTSDNLLINALAGAAKTSTLVLIAEALPNTPILCLAFNSRIAKEMSERLPKNCEARTLNSIGHRVWGDAIGKRLTIEGSKIYNLFDKYIPELPPAERREIFKTLSDLMNTVKFGKACGWVPDGTPRMRSLMTDEEFFAHLEERLEPWEQDLVTLITKQSIEQAWQGLCDYDDQILMPTLAMGAFPRFPLILVDEAQDLSVLNHAMLKKLVVKRLIAVGDRFQAIYGFRGAHEESMELLQEQFQMKEFTLSISFRCPQSVVREARWRASFMQYPDWAKEGLVSRLHHWDSTIPPDYSAILCRNNSPLFSMAIKLLRDGRYPELVGNDVGKGLLKIMKKFGLSSLPQSECLTALEAWKNEKLDKARPGAHGSINDRAICMTVFIEQTPTLGEAIALAEHIFASSGPLKLMSIHKSKGLEFDHVFILDDFLIGKEGQDRNVKYVAQTRAKQTLTYIRTEDYQ